VTRPKSATPRYYWDSNPFIAYLNGEEEFMPVLDELLQLAESEEIRLFSSAVSVLEVAFAAAEVAASNLDADTLGMIDAFWKSGLITTIEIDLVTAEEGRNLMRAGIPYGWRLSPRDALHLASAKRLEVDELQTWDGRLYKYSELIGLPVCAPHATQPRLPYSAGD
jgi:predicted nucleic acid-binding protein